MLMPVAARPRPAAKPPRLAVVLGSGGVRSIAGLGMLDVLFKEGLFPDLIVGCSTGALFGAGVAAGNTVQESFRLATSLWSPEITQQKRWTSFAQLAMPSWFGFGQDFSLRNDQLMSRRLRQAFGHVDLAHLPTALRITATDAVRGTRVVLERGDLVQAIRASIAMPMLFGPVKWGQQWLVDGVVSDPLPISAAADASMVIAMGFELAMPLKVNNASRLVMQSSTAVFNNLQQARLIGAQASAQASGQALLTILPELDRRIGLCQTSAMPYLIEAGRQATQKMLPQLRAMVNGVAIKPAGIYSASAHC